MARSAPIDVFEDNIADAERLLHLARVLTNTRKNRMRRELRGAFGTAMGLPRKHHDQLDCVESAELFVIIKPGATGRCDRFTEFELRPLLRQAVVATAAAVESYVAEKACTYIGSAMRSDQLPKRLAAMGVNFGQVVAIERRYKHRGWGTVSSSATTWWLRRARARRRSARCSPWSAIRRCSRGWTDIAGCPTARPSANWTS